MGEHIDNHKCGKRKPDFNESGEPLNRKRRVTFKNYLREVEEELLEQEDDLEDTSDE